MAGRKSASKMKRKSSNGKSATKSSTKKMPSIKGPFSKSDMIRTLTEVTDLPKRDVVGVLDCLGQIIEKHVKKGGPGHFVLPGLMKITVVSKPARPARKGINPFTGEEMMFKAKQAYKVVRIKPLKKLKEMVA